MASIGYSHIWSTDTTCNIAYVAKTHVLGTWKDGTNLSQNVTSLLQTSNYTPVVVVGESNTNNVRITGNLVVSGSITTSGAIAGGATGGSATIDASNVVSGNLNTARMPSTLQLDTISPTIYINSSGNVGIGTTGSSLARLTVSGNFISTGTVTASNYVGTISASSISAGALDKARLPSAISVNTDTQSFFISSSGFIGLGGITVPGEPLDVSGTVKATTFSGSGASLTSLNIGIGAVSPQGVLDVRSTPPTLPLPVVDMRVTYTTSGTTVNHGVKSIAVDRSGNVYVVGGYGTASSALTNFDGTDSGMTLPSVANAGAFLVKYNSSGVVLGFTFLDGANDETANHVTTDAAGNVYMSGIANATSSTVTVRNIDATASSASRTLPTTFTAYLIKWNASGIFQAYTYISTLSSAAGYKVSIDSSGFIYWPCSYNSASAFTLRNLNTSGTASSPAIQLPVSNFLDGALVKFNPSGVVVGYTIYSCNSNSDVAYSVACDSFNNVYTVGTIAGNVATTLRNIDGSGSASVYSLPAANNLMMFITKHTASGTLIGYSYIDASGSDVANAVAVDSSANVYVVGHISASGTLQLRNLNTTASTSSFTVSNPPMTQAAIVVKYDSSGVVQAYSFIDTNNATDSAFSCAVDSIGNLYVAGAGIQTATIRNLDGSGTLSSVPLILGTTGQRSGFIVRYNASGVVEAAENFTGTGRVELYSTYVDTSGYVYVGGNYASTGSVPLYNMDGTTSAITLPTPAITTGHTGFVVRYSPYGARYNITVLPEGIAINKPTASSMLDVSGTVTATAFVGSGASLTALNVGTGGAAAGQRIMDVRSKAATNVDMRVTYANSAVVTSVGVKGVAVDGSGTIYVVGGYGTAACPLNNLDGTPSGLTLPATTNGTVGGFLVKYNRSGIVQGYTYLDANNDDAATNVTVDAFGNVYLSGYIIGIADVTVRNIDATATPTSSVVPNTYSAYLIKWNAAGAFQAYTYINGTLSTTVGYKPVVDVSGSIYWACSYNSSSTITLRNLDATASVSSPAIQLPISTGSDGALVKFNPSGVVVGYSTYSGVGNDFAYSVACDTSGNVYTVGSVNSSGTTTTLRNIDGSGSASAYSLPATASSMMYITKHDASGTLSSYSYIDTSGSDLAYAVAVDSSANVYVVGIFTNSSLVTQQLRNLDATASTSSLTISNQPTTQAAIIVKYNSSGVLQAYSFIDGTSNEQALSCAVDSMDNLYVVGLYTGSSSSIPPTIRNLDGSGTMSSVTLPVGTSGIRNGFFVKYNASGVAEVAQPFIATGRVDMFATYVDPYDRVYVGGIYASTGPVSLYNMDGTTSPLTLPVPTNTSGHTGFIVRYNPYASYNVTVLPEGIAINKPTASSMLDVSGTVTATAFVGSGYAITGISAANVMAGKLPNAQLPQAFNVAVTTSGWLMVDTSGQIGIGKTSTSGTMLDVSGTVRATTLQANGIITGNAFRSYSGSFAVSATGTYNITPPLTAYIGKISVYIAQITNGIWAAQGDLIMPSNPNIRGNLSNVTTYTYTQGNAIQASLQPFGGTNVGTVVSDNPTNSVQVVVSRIDLPSTLFWTLTVFTTM